MKLKLTLLSIFLTCSINPVHAETPVFELIIKDHLFFPSELTIPANQKIKLFVVNKDDTAEEFESHEMNREKVIPGNSKAMLYIGPLKPGRYPFSGEFHPRTAKGIVIAK
ncbi:MAG: hypothetical protein COA99_14195 [Moraxellaceae bacterium]|nr:MAG: hypothetical protein COA99_14195 [Moraxellaceae bacterium]